MARKPKPAISEAMLSGFKLLDRFREILRPLDARRVKARRENDTRRKFDAEGYFVMMLFTLLNPVISSMRGLCAVSGSKQLAKQTGIARVSLGSFSEAQAVFAPDVLRGVLRELLGQAKSDPPPSLSQVLKGRAVEAIDSTLWEVISRMGWAHWRDQYSTRQNAVRLHLRWRVFGPGCGGAEVLAAKACERRVLRHDLLEPEIIYVGDRNYSGDYRLLERIGQIGSDFVVRLQDQAVIHELERLPVSPADRSKGITHHLRVSLGERGAKDLGWRLVRLERPGGMQLMILTSLPADQIGPWELCELYRQRWKIEGFFRWLKCALPCRHWLAESREGVSIQIYCALIAALLLSTRRGRLPTKREKEALDFWSMGWLDDEELAARLGIEKEV